MYSFSIIFQCKYFFRIHIFSNIKWIRTTYYILDSKYRFVKQKFLNNISILDCDRSEEAINFKIVSRNNLSSRRSPISAFWSKKLLLQKKKEKLFRIGLFKNISFCFWFSKNFIKHKGKLLIMTKSCYKWKSIK